MGLFSNPLGYAGYPPGVTGTPTTLNSTVRAATAAEAAAGTLTDVYISPATESSSVTLDFASPPVAGFGSTTPRPVATTQITMSDGGNIIVGSTTGTKIGTATTQKLGFFNATPITQPANTTDLRALLINLGFLATGGASPLNLNGGALTVGSETIADGGNITVGTVTGTQIATGATQKLGFFGATPIVQGANTTDLRALLINLGFLATGGASPLDLNGGALTVGSETIGDGGNITVGTTTGTQIGTGATQKLGFFGATPIVQGANTTDLRTLLINLGFLATGGASPLNLNGGTLTAGKEVVTTAGADIGIAVDSSAGTGVAGTFKSVDAVTDAIQCVNGSIKVPAPSISGATPVVNSVRTGQASFTDVIANGAYGVLTVTNTLVSASSIIIASASCSTANTAVQIATITPGVGSVAFNVFNAGSASTAANININFWVLN